MQKAPERPPGQPVIANGPVGPKAPKKKEPVRDAALGAGGAVAGAQALMSATNALSLTAFTADEMLTVVTAVGIIAPVVASLVARMKVTAPPR